MDLMTLPFQGCSQFSDVDADAADLDRMERFPG
jgi:hypothetical protein